MKVGGQNADGVGDPVYLNRPLHILEQMYEGGYSAVVDASKFFYQFKTHPEDQEYLGLIHPRDGKLRVWRALPMGATASPGCAGKFGLALLRKLRERLNRGPLRYKANCWWTSLREEGFDPKLGKVRIKKLTPRPLYL